MPVLRFVGNDAVMAHIVLAVFAVSLLEWSTRVDHDVQVDLGGLVVGGRLRSRQLERLPPGEGRREVELRDLDA